MGNAIFAFSEKENLMVCAYQKKIVFLDSLTLSEVWTYEFPNQIVRISFSFDGTLLFGLLSNGYAFVMEKDLYQVRIGNHFPYRKIGKSGIGCEDCFLFAFQDRAALSLCMNDGVHESEEIFLLDLSGHFQGCLRFCNASFLGNRILLENHRTEGIVNDFQMDGCYLVTDGKGNSVYLFSESGEKELLFSVEEGYRILFVSYRKKQFLAEKCNKDGKNLYLCCFGKEKDLSVSKCCIGRKEVKNEWEKPEYFPGEKSLNVSADLAVDLKNLSFVSSGGLIPGFFKKKTDSLSSYHIFEMGHAVVLLSDGRIEIHDKRNGELVFSR